MVLAFMARLLVLDNNNKKYVAIDRIRRLMITTSIMTGLQQIPIKTDVQFMSKVDPIVYVLRRYRENKGISQEKMSVLTGISVSTIQRIESGRSDMKLSQYRSYLAVLEMSDMDVSIALFSHEFVTEKDVAAMARKFPLRVKQVIVRFLDELADVLKE